MPTKQDTKGNAPSYEYNACDIGYFGDWNQKPFGANVEQLKRYLMNPQIENRALRDMCWWAYTSNGVIRNVVDDMVALPTLDRVVYSKAKKKNGKRPDSYRNNKNKFSAVLDLIKDKEMARDSLLKNCNDGASYYYFIADQKPYEEKFIDPLVVAMLTEINTIETNALENVNCSLFALPTDYCKIVSIKNNSYEIAFDLFYFNQFIASGLSRKLMQYPKEIRDAWKKFNVNTGSNRWLILDNTKTVVTKIGAKREECYGRPIAAEALYDILYYNYFIDTKRNTLDSINNKAIYETFPEGKEKGTSAMTTDQQRLQHETIKNALNHRKEGQWGLTFFSLAAGTQLDKIDTDTGILDSKNEEGLFDKISGDVGFGAPLLHGSSKGNYATLKLNLELISAKIFSWIKQFQTELNKVINCNIIKDRDCFVEVDYLPTTYVNKSDMIANMKDLYLQGKGSWQAWVSSTGLNFDSFIAMIEDEQEQDYENKFPVHKTSFTMTSNETPPKDNNKKSDKENEKKSRGRPPKKNPDNENTIKSQATASNEQPKPSQGGG